MVRTFHLMVETLACGALLQRDLDPFIVVAAYNEAAVISEVVGELLAAYRYVVVVDDGSVDETGATARNAGAIVLHHSLNRGQGAALQTGFEYSLQHGAKYVVTFDADGQHRVEEIALLLEPIRSGRADVVLGSRFTGKAPDMPPSRRLALRLAVLFTRVVSGARLSDTHNGLRAFSRRALTCVQITHDRMAHASELIDQIVRSHLPYLEVPVTIRYTPYSRAKGQRLSGSLRIVADYLSRRILGA
jgi:glycosyltransferase involved in cell wall biosynthesis